MAPYSKSVQVEPSSETFGDNGRVYRGSVDLEWMIGRNSCTIASGYILGLLVEAAMQYQSTTTQKDPIHVTAHYLRPSTPGAFEIHVRVIKSGRDFTNLAADLFQKNTLKVTTHIIFARNGPASTDKALLTLQPPSSYARRIPLHSHPSGALKQEIRYPWGFKDHIEMSEEAEIHARNKINHPNRTNSASIGGGGTEWGSWISLAEKGERITSPAIAFFADMCPNSLILLPRSERQGLVNSWFPTLTLSIEFKSPIPPPSEHNASRTVGLYSTGTFMNHPQSRHEMYVEVWTAPTNLGEGKPVDGWRDKQVCLAIATQMALAIPFEEAGKRADKEVARL
ncbi:hypothetical protein AN958_07545 [Leucoagaricus sp. SymC.cos]|nr:hypothetical protein AN958_07545 [Leucoagaricus sp. SymC.cos]